MSNDPARFHFSKPSSGCPVCSSRKHTVSSKIFLCCSIACEEAVTDAKENINWLRVKDSDLHAELHEFQEKFGRMELRYRRVLIKLQKAGKRWQHYANADADTGVGELLWVEEVEKKISAWMLRIHLRHCKLDKRWRVLKETVLSSEREIATLEAILRKVE